MVNEKAISSVRTSINLSKYLNKSYGTMYFVKDMKKAVTFYRDVLGLKPTFESDDWTEFDFKGHVLCLHNADPKIQSGTNGILILDVNDIHELVTHMKMSGVEFAEGIKQVSECGVAADFRDPDGNLVSLYEHTAK